MKMLFGFAAPLLASPALAQQSPPPYVQFTEIADRYAVLVTSVSSCGTLGFSVDSEAIEEMALGLVEGGVEQGIELDFASRIVVQAVQREEADMTFLMRQVDGDDPEDVERYLRFWASRCERLAQDYPEVISG